MDNKIQFIDQRLAHLCSLIPQCKALSAAAEKRLADTIITLETKRIEAIHVLEKRLGELRTLIPVYKACSNTYEHVLAKHIINIDLQLIEAKTKQLPTQPTAQNLLVPYPCAPLSPTVQPPTPQPIQSNDINGILLNALNRFPIYIGNKVSALTLQSVISDRVDTCLVPMPCPTSIRRLLEPGSIVDAT